MSLATALLNSQVAATFHASSETAAVERPRRLSQADVAFFAGQLEVMRRELTCEIAHLQQRTSFTPAGPFVTTTV